MNNRRNLLKLATRLVTLALLTLVSTSLAACDDDSQQQPITGYENYNNGYSPEPSPSPTAPGPTPFPTFYGDGPGGSFYGH
jgi:hypothetical protein